MTLLENSLGLLEEQEQSQREMLQSTATTSNTLREGQTIIRTIRAKRSGMQVVLVRKQRKGKRNSNQGNNDPTNDNDYYLVLPGKDRTDAYNQVHRRGMHCTCRSFLNNIKGGGRKNSNNHAAATTDNVAFFSQSIICKHLLAVILMPHLMPWRMDGVGVEVLEDRKFAKLVASCQV